MTAPPDTFSKHFDSIEIDPARAPSPAAIERAICLAGEEQPGFYLLDDAHGRFIVDRDTGVISLSDESWLAREHGAVHTARLRVVEPSGGSYELDMQLRLTGCVPQMVGAEEFAFSEGGAAQRPAVAWTAFAATRAVGACSRLGGEASAFGALLAAELTPADLARASLTLAEALPAPAPATAPWTV